MLHYSICTAFTASSSLQDNDKNYQQDYLAERAKIKKKNRPTDAEEKDNSKRAHQRLLLLPIKSGDHPMKARPQSTS